MGCCSGRMGYGWAAVLNGQLHYAISADVTGHVCAT